MPVLNDNNDIRFDEGIFSILRILFFCRFVFWENTKRAKSRWEKFSSNWKAIVFVDLKGAQFIERVYGWIAFGLEIRWQNE